MDLKDVDLNLLLVFHHLLLERRVSVVAEKLGVTQPAVSNALKHVPQGTCIGQAKTDRGSICESRTCHREFGQHRPRDRRAVDRTRRVRRTIRLTVPHFVAVGHILSTSNLVATVPERYSMECARPFGLNYATHPVALPEVDINVFWHAKFNKDPANQWMRDIVFNTFADGARAA